MWIRVFPDKPITKKPLEVRMGSGKGNVEYWVAQIQPGRMMYEIEGVDEATAREAFRLAARQALGDHHIRDPDGALMELKRTASEVGRRAARPTCSSCSKEQFTLRMQKATGQLAKTHEVRRVRREIARVEHRCCGAKK